MRATVLGLILVAVPSVVAAKPPKECAVGVSLTKRDAHGTLTGKLTRFERRAGEPQFIEATLDDGTTSIEFTLYATAGLRAASAPFARLARGATVTMAYQCGGGRQLVCDARIEDARGRVVVIASGSGGDALSAGWTSKVGKILASRPPNPAANAPSVQRTHELELAHDRVVAHVSERCARVVDGKHTYLATGSAVSWLGLRPPEGVDSSSYSLVLER